MLKPIKLNTLRKHGSCLLLKEYPVAPISILVQINVGIYPYNPFLWLFWSPPFTLLATSVMLCIYSENQASLIVCKPTKDGSHPQAECGVYPRQLAAGPLYLAGIVAEPQRSSIQAA